MCKIITFCETTRSRRFERGGNDGFGGFLRFYINGKEAYSSSIVRSMVIRAEDGEGVCSFRFFSYLTGLNLVAFDFWGLRYPGIYHGYLRISSGLCHGYNNILEKNSKTTFKDR